MDNATKQLFEFVEKCHNEEVEFDFSKLCVEIKDLIDIGADINATNNDGFNILQVILEVESPEQSLISRIEDEGFFYDEGFFVDACLRNGFKCSTAELTKLLSVYCGCNYRLEPGDIKLICTLLEMGADWNCKYYAEYSHVPLLFTLAGSPITKELWHSSSAPIETSEDVRYKMLSAYYKAGGDLLVQHNGKHVWEIENLPPSALAFLLEHNADVPTEYVKILPTADSENGDIVATDYCFCICPPKLFLDEHIFIPETFKVLSDNKEKYPHIFDEISGCAWTNLLSEYPQFCDICDWNKLTKKDWERLLNAQPLLKKYRK